MGYKPSQEALNKAYAKGLKDAAAKHFDPPRGSVAADVVFGLIDKMAGSPSSREMAEALGQAYRDGHSAGTRK